MGSAETFEQERIRLYAMGWNDAALGRAPRLQALTYALGYLDATR
jgi:hypothetical protein